MYVNGTSRSKEKMMKMRANLMEYQQGVKISGRQLIQPKVNHLNTGGRPSVYDNLNISPGNSPINGPFSERNSKSLRTSM